ncbi:hypothetical protein ACVIJ6_006632 [Bradyrhizobium sp. USDA 4369]
MKILAWGVTLIAALRFSRLRITHPVQPQPSQNTPDRGWRRLDLDGNLLTRAAQGLDPSGAAGAVHENDHQVLDFFSDHFSKSKPSAAGFLGSCCRRHSRCIQHSFFGPKLTSMFALVTFDFGSHPK